MTDSENHSIRNGIVITVIGGLILAALIYLISKFYNFVLQLFDLLKIALASLFLYLSSSTTLPNIIFWLLIVLAMPTLIRTGQFFVKKKMKNLPDEPRISQYIQDEFFGLIWRWSFITDQNLPTSDIWCFCPNCSTRLISNSTKLSYGRNNYLTEFICETCNFKSKPFDGLSSDVLEKIGRQVERRVNTGEWKEIVRNEQPAAN